MRMGSFLRRNDKNRLPLAAMRRLVKQCPTIHQAVNDVGDCFVPRNDAISEEIAPVFAMTNKNRMYKCATQG